MRWRESWLERHGIDLQKALIVVGIGERRGVEIHSDDASVGRGFQNCFAVSAKANRAIYKETSSLRSEEFQCLFSSTGRWGAPMPPISAAITTAP